MATPILPPRPPQAQAGIHAYASTNTYPSASARAHTHTPATHTSIRVRMCVTQERFFSLLVPYSQRCEVFEESCSEVPLNDLRSVCKELNGQ